MDVRKKLKFYHTSGRYGHARLEEKMKQQKEDDPPPTRAEVWIEAHTRKDGSIPSSLSSHIEKIENLLSSQNVADSHDILNDPLTKVFGVDTKGRVCGVGNVVSRTQIVLSSPALEKLAAKDKKTTERSNEIKDLKDQVKCIFEELGGIKQMIEVKIN